METSEGKSPAARQPPHDPYPRMIIACIIITAVLMVFIFGVLLFDFISRSQQGVQPITPMFREEFPAPPDTAAPEAAPPLEWPAPVS